MMLFLQRHIRTVVVITAVLVGCVYASRHFFLREALQGTGLEYIPFTVAADFDGVWAYGPRLHEVLDGHLIVADTDTYEYRNHLPVYPFIPPLAQAPFLLLTGSLAKGLFMSDFFFAAAFFLLFYGFGKRVFLRRLLAYFFSIVGTLALYLPIWSTRLFWDSPRHILKYVLPWSHLESTLLARRESQMPDAIFLIIAAWALWDNIQKPGWRTTLRAAVSGALLVWVYPYYAAYILFAASVRLMIAFLARDWRVVKRLCWIPLVIGLGFYVSSSWSRFTGVPVWDMLLRQGVEFGHALNRGAWKHDLMMVVVAVLLGVLGWRRYKQHVFFAWSLLGAGFIGRNIQILSGWNLQPDHWVSRVDWFSVLLCWVLLVVWGGQALARRYPVLARVGVPLVILFTLFSFLRTTHGQWLFAQQNAQYYALSQEESNFYEQVNQRIERDAVIATPSFSSAVLVPLVTRGRIYLPRAHATLASSREIEDRALLLWNFFGVSPATVARLMSAEENGAAHGVWHVEGMGIFWIFGSQYAPQNQGFYFNEDLSNKTYFIQDERVLAFVQAYQELYQQHNRLSLLQTFYRVDYVLWGPAEQTIAPDFHPEKMDGLSLVYTDGIRSLYRMK